MRTFRRTLLDEALTRRAHLLTGRVLDVGGKKVRKRGRFRPEIAPAESWLYLNVDADSEPDILASADAIPVDDSHFDAILMSEVLEHLRSPEDVLAEARRVLRPDGRLVATIPFLFPVHGDPDDFQRWTPEKLQLELGRAGLEVEELSPMGSAAAVVFDLCWIAWNAYAQRLPIPLQKLATAPFLALKPLVALLDSQLGRVRRRITTGYLIVARKPADSR